MPKQRACQSSAQRPPLARYAAKQQSPCQAPFAVFIAEFWSVRRGSPSAWADCGHSMQCRFRRIDPPPEHRRDWSGLAGRCGPTVGRVSPLGQLGRLGGRGGNEDLLQHLPLHRLLDDRHVSEPVVDAFEDRKSTRLNSSHVKSSYAVFCLKKKKE